MKVAVKYGAHSHEPMVDSNGELIVHTAGMRLVKRLLELFPGAQLVGPEPRRANGFEVVPLEFVDAQDTLVINMDVIDSVAVFQVLHRGGAEPKIMNFEWINPSTYHHPVNYAAMGLAFAFFPTFCNSERTAGEVREVVRQWAPGHLAEQAKIAWVNLGVHATQVRERQHTDTPVVLYPAITLADRKNPQLFEDIVGRVQRRTPIRVEARLHEHHLISEYAMRLGAKDWFWVGPLSRTESYWEALSRTTAFVATATEESYGLEYVEAMLAGAIGIFPDRPWVRQLLPEGYPFVYADAAQGEQMLYRAVTEPDACRAELDRCADGDFAAWVRAKHSHDDFDRAVKAQVEEWFGR